MTNIQFEKITSYVANLRKNKKEKVALEVELLLSQVKDIYDNILSMERKTESDYIHTSGIKLTIDRIDTALAEMSALDSVKHAQGMIEENFPQEEEVSEDKESVYWYSYRHRGFSIGCQPKDFVAQLSDVGRFGIIGYERELTEKEISDFELDFYGEETYVKNIYDKPKMAHTTMWGEKVEVIGEQTVTMVDGRVIEQYLYNIMDKPAYNGKPYASHKDNVVLEK